MKAVQLNKYRVVTPKDVGYERIARQFGAYGNHFAVNLYNSRIVEMLPKQYLLLRGNDREGIVEQKFKED